MPHRRATDTEPMDRMLLLAIQLQGQWRSISTELSPERHRGWPPLPSQRNESCSAITEESEVSWSRQHPSRTSPGRWRGCNHRSHDNLQQDLADRRMANLMDPVLSHHTLQERQPAAVPELNNNPHQSPKQSHAEDHTEQIEATSGEDHRRRTGRLQSRKGYHRSSAYAFYVGNISSTSKTSTMSSYTSRRPSTRCGPVAEGFRRRTPRGRRGIESRKRRNSHRLPCGKKYI